MLLGSAIASRIYFPEPSLLFFKFQYFIAGILIFRALRAEEDEVERIALAAVAVLLVSGAPGYYGSQVVWLPLLAVAMLALGWMETRGITPPAISRVVRSRVVRFASDTPSSVYLFHLMFVSIGGLILQSHRELFLPWRSSARAGLLLLFVAACSYPLGYVIHRFVELPESNLGSVYSAARQCRHVRPPRSVYEQQAELTYVKLATLMVLPAVIRCVRFSRTHFAFGKAGLDLELPSGFEYRVLEARSAKALANERAALEAAIDSPVAGPSLFQLAQNKRSAAISVCDITRPAPNRRVLPPLLNRLERAGITRDKVTVCIANGAAS